MARKKLTKLQSDYQKEVNRLSKAQKKYEKKGYIYKENSIPKMPKRVTQKALSEIKKLKPTDIIKKFVEVVEYLGKSYTPKEYQKVKRQESEQAKQQQLEQAKQDYYNYQQNQDEATLNRESYANIVIEQMYDYFRGLPKNFSDELIASIEHIRKEVGSTSLAYALNEAPNDFIYYLTSTQYDSDSAVTKYTAQILEYLPISVEDRIELAEQMEELGLLGGDYEEV